MPCRLKENNLFRGWLPDCLWWYNYLKTVMQFMQFVCTKLLAALPKRKHRVFKNSKILSCVVAFYSTMMHAKRNTYAKFQQDWCGFGTPVTHFPISARRARKPPYLLYIKKYPRALQVGPFSGELRGEQTFQKNLCSKIDSTLWKCTFILLYFIGSWLYTMDEKCQYFTINVCFHNVESILEHMFLYNICLPFHFPLAKLWDNFDFLWGADQIAPI